MGRTQAAINKIKSNFLGHTINIPEPERLIIEKAKWLHNARSPVLFMIDDLTNAWNEKEGRSKDGPEYDWGGKHFERNAVLTFLSEKLLIPFPHVKVSYFTVVGTMHSFNTKSHFVSAKAMDADEESVHFFRSLGFSERGEIAYHGVHHGAPGERSDDYVQEWESFKTVEQGIALISRGKEIYHRVFGFNPTGGKYGGYKKNHLSDQTIEKSGFTWWCRDWTPRDTTGTIPDHFYEADFFGVDRKVVSIPSTLHGGKWTKKQVEILLRKKQVISIQEHISPCRPDGMIQTPNIIDDIDRLRQLFAYLEKKHVWYTTGSELATYFIAFSESRIYNVTDNSFFVDFRGDIVDPLLTIHIDARCLCSRERPHINIFLPGGQILSGNHIRAINEKYLFMVDLPVRSGRYTLTAADKPAGSIKAEATINNDIQFNHPNMAGVVEIELASDQYVLPIITDNYRRINGKINMEGNIFFYCSNSSLSYRLASLEEVAESENNK